MKDFKNNKAKSTELINEPKLGYEGGVDNYQLHFHILDGCSSRDARVQSMPLFN